MFNENQYYDKAQVCARLMISTSKLNRMLSTRVFPYVKLGRSVRLLGSDINKVLQENKK